MITMENTNPQFWLTLEETYRVQIPVYVKNLLEIMGYGNPISFQRITKSTLADIENFVRTTVSLPRVSDAHERDFLGTFYTHERGSFKFTPGDKDLILGLADRVREYSQVFKKLLNY